MKEKDYVKELSIFVHGLTADNLSKELIQLTRQYIADYISSALAGFKVNRDLNESILSILSERGGKKDATVLLSNEKFSVEDAAFINAVYAHGADMDDGNKKSMGHVAAHTISSVFALAEALDVTWGEVFVAIQAGYEVFNRIGAAAQPGLAHRGFHSTGMVGGMACAAACAKLMRLNAEQIYSAISIASVQSSGLLIITESGQECKPLNPANATRTGILSALLAKKGIKGPSMVLQHPKGWFHATTEKANTERIVEGLGERFTMEECYLKPYPSCRHTHSLIECALRIREEMAKDGDFKADRIEKIKIYTYSNAVRVAGQIQKPVADEETKFSIHYAFACALAKGSFAICDLSVANAPKEIWPIIEKTEIVIDEKWEDFSAGVRGGMVEVITENKKVYSFAVKTPKGEGENPFTREDTIEKLKGCAEGILTDKEQRDLLFRIDEIDLSKKYRPIKIG